MDLPKIDFKAFLEFFPLVELPVLLNEESQHHFSNFNDPIPGILTEQYIAPFEEEGLDEFTEVVACFKVPETHGFHALVHWKAGLMNYQFVLSTFTPEGGFIDKRAVAGFFYDGHEITQSVATINEDWEIIIVSGKGPKETGTYDPALSRVYKLEMLPDGKIVNQ